MKQFKIEIITPLQETTYHMGSLSVTCHLAAVTFPPLPQPKLVLDLATTGGCKAELIWYQKLEPVYSAYVMQSGTDTRLWLRSLNWVTKSSTIFWRMCHWHNKWYLNVLPCGITKTNTELTVNQLSLETYYVTVGIWHRAVLTCPQASSTENWTGPRH